MAGIVATSATSTTSFATTTSTFDDSLVVAPLFLTEEVHVRPGLNICDFNHQTWGVLMVLRHFNHCETGINIVII